MEILLHAFAEQLVQTSIWEWAAVVFAIAYVLLAIKESLWCWPAAFISTAIYSVLFFDVNLFMQSVLNIYYLLMAIYGWYQWKTGEHRDGDKKIERWPVRKHLAFIVFIVAGILVSGYLLDNYTSQSLAYLDSSVTWFAVFATFLLARKILENWIYWIVIDSVSVYLYLQKEFLVTGLLFAAYTIMAVFGWLQWKKHLDKYSTP
ncbi:nicotinamide riboside transporter PnuC [Aliikangiella sp. G2MR2-5]|uniref:nicotinamide riboside transporter PnuC n=1 Tax=Aliikangiella sp. G2MR2-5 TaxID=2788943 RepID=UPI0018AC076C|nr:nicotinamide riboside transporter PnuC [Aliikangiella sp. G2MR2-5]